jgi:hypothetical protein
MNLCQALLTTINEAAMKQTGKPLPGFTLKDGKLAKKPAHMSVSQKIKQSKSKKVRVSKRTKGAQRP